MSFRGLNLKHIATSRISAVIDAVKQSLFCSQNTVKTHVRRSVKASASGASRRKTAFVSQGGARPSLDPPLVTRRLPVRKGYSPPNPQILAPLLVSLAVCLCSMPGPASVINSLSDSNPFFTTYQICFLLVFLMQLWHFVML